MGTFWGAETLPGIGGTHFGLDSLGTPGALVPSDGEHGASYLYNDLTLPADAAVEVYGPIETWPVGLATFVANEDGSFTASGPDGVYAFTYRFYADLADLGTAVATITIGNPASGTLSGGIALDLLAPGGAFASGPSSLSGAIVLGDAIASGGFTVTIIGPCAPPPAGDYATPCDMVQAFGERECRMISDRDDTGTVDDAVLQIGLNAARDEINFAAGQHCTLPLAIGDPSVAQFLKQLCLDIARYRLTGASGVTVNDDCENRYKEAKATLDKIIAGKILLCDPGAGSPGAGGGGLSPNNITAGAAESTSADRAFTRDSLDDYVAPRSGWRFWR